MYIYVGIKLKTPCKYLIYKALTPVTNAVLISNRFIQDLEKLAAIYRDINNENKQDQSQEPNNNMLEQYNANLLELDRIESNKKSKSKKKKRRLNK